MKSECIICGSCESKSFVKTDKFSSVKCKECGLVYVVSQQDPLVDDYYTEEMQKNYHDYYRDFRFRIFNKVLSIIDEYLMPEQEKSLLDIGCSYGWFLECGRQHNYKVFGVEPSKNICASIKEQYDVVCMTAEDFLNNNNKVFSVVSLWNVLEHLSAPDQIISNISRVQNSSSLVIITVPNANGFINKCLMLLNRLSFHFVKKPLDILFQSNSNYMHLYYFSAKHIEQLLETNGYKVVNTIQQEIIDVSNIKKRCEMESLSLLATYSCIFPLRIANYISNILKRMDEIIIIGVKK